MPTSEDWLLDDMRAQRRRISGLAVLSGQAKLRTRHGIGIENELVTREGDVLDEDVEIFFNDARPLIFHAYENRLMENVLALVQAKNDMLTSGDTCIKPIYSPPRGSSSAADSHIYTFECSDLICSPPSAQLPYNVYVTGGNKGVQILARPVSVHMWGDEYIKFEPNSVTVQEVLEVCRRRHKELNKATKIWGIRSVKAHIQPPAGKFKRSADHLEYRLCDLLSGEAFLPLERSAKSLVLTDNVSIRTSNSAHDFVKGTNLTSILSRWRVASDTYCPSQANAACVLDVDDVLSGRQMIPTYRGVVTRTNLVLQWITGHTICFPTNTLFEYIITTLFRLRRMNEPLKYKYRFTTDGEKVIPKTICHYEDIAQLTMGDEDVLVILAPNVAPVLVRVWGHESDQLVAAAKKVADDKELEHRSKAAVWTAGKVRR